MVKSPAWAIKEKIIARKKNFSSRKFTVKSWKIISAISTENNEKIKEPNTPDKVFLGLILVNFFHLKIFPKTYPPTSEHIHKIITHNKR